MSTINLNEQIINKVNSISDESVLEEIYQFLQTEDEEIYKLSEQEIKAVEEGLEDIRKGRMHTSEQANQLIREWLKK